jgi:hypothetical protein
VFFCRKKENNVATASIFHPYNAMKNGTMYHGSYNVLVFVVFSLEQTSIYILKFTFYSYSKKTSEKTKYCVALVMCCWQLMRLV